MRRPPTHTTATDATVLQHLTVPQLAQTWLNRREMLRRHPSPEALALWQSVDLAVWRRRHPLC